jgi:hypothetical protein
MDTTGGDAGCPEITNCQTNADYGVPSAPPSIVGFEAEVGAKKNFFGETSNQSSNVLTFMGNSCWRRNRTGSAANLRVSVDQTTVRAWARQTSEWNGMGSAAA